MNTSSLSFAISLIVLLIALEPNLTQANPNRNLLAASCQPSGYIKGKTGDCDTSHGAKCCLVGKSYPQYKCSPPVTSNTKAILRLSCFDKTCAFLTTSCDNMYHSDSEMVVALSTGWYNSGSRCGKMIKISANNKSALTKVVDECSSFNGCIAELNYEVPCGNNIVDATQAVWYALGLDLGAGEVDVTWSDHATTGGEAQDGSGEAKASPIRFELVYCPSIKS